MTDATANRRDMSDREVFELFHKGKLSQKLYWRQTNTKLQRETVYKSRKMS